MSVSLKRRRIVSLKVARFRNSWPFDQESWAAATTRLSQLEKDPHYHFETFSIFVSAWTGKTFPANIHIVFRWRGRRYLQCKGMIPTYKFETGMMSRESQHLIPCSAVKYLPFFRIQRRRTSCSTELENIFDNLRMRIQVCLLADMFARHYLSQYIRYGQCIVIRLGAGIVGRILRRHHEGATCRR